MTSNSNKAIAKDLDKKGLNRSGADIILMCNDRDTAKCASAKQMKRCWKHLKGRVKKVNKEKDATITVIPTQCLGICKAGPLIGVYPEARWFTDCNPEKIDSIVEECSEKS